MRPARPFPYGNGTLSHPFLTEGSKHLYYSTRKIFPHKLHFRVDGKYVMSAAALAGLLSLFLCYVKISQTCINTVVNKKPITAIVMGFMRKKRLELSQDKLPLEPESSASAIPPLPLDKKYLITMIWVCKPLNLIFLRKHFPDFHANRFRVFKVQNPV